MSRTRHPALPAALPAAAEADALDALAPIGQEFVLETGSTSQKDLVVYPAAQATTRKGRRDTRPPGP
jgi:hypothetical protein